MFANTFLQSITPACLAFTARPHRSARSHARLRALAFCCAALCAGSASAAGQHSVDGQKIITLATGWGSEGFYVTTTGPLPSGADCGSGNIFMLENGNPLHKEVVAMLMMAVQNKTPVNLFVDGCTGGSMTLKAVSFSVG